ncbi:MAG: signal peptidase I, partial [Acidimicrobiales bacterium]
MSPLPPDGPLPPAAGPAEAGGTGAQTSTDDVLGSGGTPTGDPASPTGSDTPRRGGRHQRPRRHRWVVEWAVVIVVALVVAFVVRTYVAQTFFVPSTSMYPTLKDGDRIVVDKLAYHLHAVHRGDIVVFKTPPTEHCGGPPVPDLVKRVIG